MADVMQYNCRHGSWFLVASQPACLHAHLVRTRPDCQTSSSATAHNDVIVNVGVQEERQLLAVPAATAT